MKIYFKRSGGFEGSTTDVALNTNSLSPDESLNIKQLLNDAKFFDLPSKSAAPKRGAADYFKYKITVETEQRMHTVETTDVSMNPMLHSIVNFLNKKAEEQ